MRCHACAGTYTEMPKYHKSWRKLYKCFDCDHVYIDFLGDEVEYHAKDYRSKGNQAYRKAIHSERLVGICKKRVDWFINNVDLQEEKKHTCYEVGAGGGTFARELTKHLDCEYVCNEVSEMMLEECKRLGFKTNNTNINEIQFEKKYDFIFAWHVIEHIKDFPPLIGKIKQNLNGKLIVEVPTNPLSHLFKKKEWDGHSHYFSQKSFDIFFNNNGFKILKKVDGIQSKEDRPSILAIMEKK